MSTAKLISLLLLIVGIVLLVWGINASNSMASEISEAVQGAPSDKAIIWIVLGAIVALAGVAGLLRGRRVA